MQFKVFYATKKDQRILDNPGDVGGRDPEITQLVDSLYSRLRELFPINCVPSYLLENLTRLRDIAEEFESVFQDFIESAQTEYNRWCVSVEAKERQDEKPD